MSTDDHSQNSNGRDEILAGEYVVGVLSVDARRAVEKRMESDAAFAAIVKKWEGELSAFNEHYDEVAPDKAVFKAIEGRLFGSPPQAAETVTGFWNSLVLWRSLTFALLIAFASYATIQSGMVGRTAPAAPMTAEMVSKDGPVTLMARYDSGNGRLQVTPVAASSESARSLELWMVPGDNQPTISLGVLPQDGEGALIIPADMRSRMHDGMVLAVSVEPYGGSPTGQATGPVIAAGQIRSF